MSSQQESEHKFFDRLTNSDIERFWTFVPIKLEIGVQQGATNTSFPVLHVHGDFYFIELATPQGPGGEPTPRVMSTFSPDGQGFTFSLPLALFDKTSALDISGNDVLNAMNRLFGKIPFLPVPPAPSDLDQIWHRIPPGKRAELAAKLKLSRRRAL